MLILLPPSEGKTAPATGDPLTLDALDLPALNPARERVLRIFEEQHITLNMVIALPSLDGIKRAVELELGVALLPRRCAVTGYTRHSSAPRWGC